MLNLIYISLWDRLQAALATGFSHFDDGNYFIIDIHAPGELNIMLILSIFFCKT